VTVLSKAAFWVVGLEIGRGQVSHKAQVSGVGKPVPSNGTLTVLLFGPAASGVQGGVGIGGKQSTR
jgi:hypothetical protein